MDDRQTQIREGAGLEESRINKDFINFLNKWSSPVIMVLAIGALAWAGWRYIEQRKLERIDQAFGDLADATSGGNPSPASLLALAEEYQGIRAVPTLAKLTTIDVYLDAYIRGVQPGAEISRLTGEPVNETDVLDDEQRAVYLEQAGTLADEVIAATSEDPDKVLLTINALFRAAAVAECERDFDKAKSHYERVIERAEPVSYASIAQLARQRIEQVDRFNVDLTLPDASELAALPGRPAPRGATEIPPEVLEQLQGMEVTPGEPPADAGPIVPQPDPQTDEPEPQQGEPGPEPDAP